MRKYIKTKEAAEYLSTSVGTVRRLVYAGQLRPVRFFRGFRFEIGQLHEFMKRYAR